jgi:predicted small secreted protein
MLTQQVPSLFINFAVLVLSLLLAGVLWYDDLLIISFELLSYLLTLCNKETDMGVGAQHGLELFGTMTSRLTKL